MTKEWKIDGKTVSIVKSGPVIEYPWDLSSGLSIKATHTVGSIALGDIVNVKPCEVFNVT